MTIYIRPDGTISGINEPLPLRPERDESLYNFLLEGQDKFNTYIKALTAWKESCKDFEDQRYIWELLFESGCSHPSRRGVLIPDTIIENVDVETEVVKQWRLENEEWKDGEPEKMWGNTLPTRTVLRIKDKP